MADGLTSLGTIRFGTSTGGGAVSPDDTTTLGVARSDTRVPPDTSHIWGAQLTAFLNFCLAVGQLLKSGTRLGTATQSSNPFGAAEQGFWVDTSGNPQFAYGGSTYRVGAAIGATVAQATNVNTAVTINGSSGVITTQTATTAARTAEAGFTVTNSAVTSTSVIIPRVIGYSGTLFTNGQPDVDITSVANGSFNIRIINRDATNALNGTMKIHFIVQ